MKVCETSSRYKQIRGTLGQWVTERNYRGLNTWHSRSLGQWVTESETIEIKIHGTLEQQVTESETIEVLIHVTLGQWVTRSKAVEMHKQQFG